jgi:hypothetical protein
MSKLVGALLAGLMIGAHGAALAQAKPAAKAQAAKADPAKAAMEKAVDKAVANYNRNKGGGAKPAAMDKAAAKKK